MLRGLGARHILALSLAVSNGMPVVSVAAASGATSAHLGGAPLWNRTWRVSCWGAIAMLVTTGAGALFGAVVSAPGLYRISGLFGNSSRPLSCAGKVVTR